VAEHPPADRMTLPCACVALNRTYHLELTGTQLYKLVCRAAVPATNLRGRWYIDPADLPTIAERLRVLLAPRAFARA
jgi:hypothetical protein